MCHVIGWGLEIKKLGGDKILIDYWSISTIALNKWTIKYNFLIRARAKKIIKLSWVFIKRARVGI